MSESKKPREFWMLPQKGADCEWTNLYPDASWNGPTKPLIHAIEYSAYAKQQAVIADLLAALEKECADTQDRDCEHLALHISKAIAKAKRELEG